MVNARRQPLKFEVEPESCPSPMEEKLALRHPVKAGRTVGAGVGVGKIIESNRARLRS